MTHITARRNADKFFKTNHYRFLDNCCAICRFSEAGYEGEYWCMPARGESGEWSVGDIAPYGLCDQFAAPEPGKEE